MRNTYNDNLFMGLIIGVATIVILILFFSTFNDASAQESYEFQVASVTPYAKGSGERAVLIEVASDACPQGEIAMMLVVYPTTYFDEAPISKNCDDANANTYTMAELEWLASTSMWYMEDGVIVMGEFITNMDTSEFYAQLDSALEQVMELEFTGPWHVNRVTSHAGVIYVWFGESTDCPDGLGYFSIQTLPRLDYGDFENAGSCAVNARGGLAEDEAAYLIEHTMPFIEEGHALPAAMRIVGMDKDEYYGQIATNYTMSIELPDAPAIGIPPVEYVLTNVFLPFIGW